MKNKVTIKNNQDETLQFVFFEDQQIQDEWIQMLANTSAWGEVGEYSVTIEDFEGIKTQEEINQEALTYLFATDHHVFKMMELGTPMPEGMSVLRQQARDRIVRS